MTNYNAETHTYKEYLSRDIEQVSLSIEANNMYTTITSGETTGTPIISINNISVKRPRGSIYNICSNCRIRKNARIYNTIIKKIK